MEVSRETLRWKPLSPDPQLAVFGALSGLLEMSPPWAFQASEILENLGAQRLSPNEAGACSRFQGSGA